METDFSASQALLKSKQVGIGYSAAADNLNYTLTLKRVLGTIKTSAERGEKHVAYVVPWFVIDGTTANQNILAKQVKKRLLELGYMVKRDGHRLFIDWDLDLVERENTLAVQQKQKEAKAQKVEQERMKELHRQAKFGKRPSKRIMPPPCSSISKANSSSSSSSTNTFSVVKRKRKKSTK
jgi:hypothetical protein